MKSVTLNHLQGFLKRSLGISFRKLDFNLVTYSIDGRGEAQTEVTLI